MEQRSGTPMATRLGFKPGMRVWFHDMPQAVRDAIAPERAALEELGCATDGVQAVHLFTSRRDHLERELGALRGLLARNGFCWVSWPEQAETSELAGGTVADIAAAHGWEERDRCTFQGWSGVKLTPCGPLHPDQGAV
ncbi:hypothetical protein S2M10_01100 [Sphingomonas sp. S2M10]|uniref:hypothetical protein n=1 Tax=Sphingomonas sp. S2M10 TaxID=2705010 RepID=UPI0014571831|nr:hypothetical protein [Sphingomonas sp. S2M10]NLS25147.1 hypothetical protein [Sphingomonas sp. S2M10]